MWRTLWPDLRFGMSWLALWFAVDCLTSASSIRSAASRVGHDPEVAWTVAREVGVYVAQVGLAYVLMGLVAGVFLHLLRATVRPRDGRRLRWAVATAVTGWVILRGAIQWPRVYRGLPGQRWLADTLPPWSVDLAFGAVAALWLILALRRARPGWTRALALAGVVAMIAAADHQPAADTPAQNKGPNVLIFGVDALRPDHVSAFGYERETTPHLDGFLQQAVVYDAAFTPQARTWPAWNSILTGADPMVHRQRDSLPSPEDPLPAVPTITQRLQAEGWHTRFLTDDSRFSYMVPGQGWDVIDQPPVGIRAFAPSRYQPQFRAFFHFLHGPLGWWLVPTYRYNQAYGATLRPEAFAEHVADALAEASEHERFFMAVHTCLLHAPGERVWPYHTLYGQTRGRGVNRFRYRSTGSVISDGAEVDEEALRKLERSRRSRRQNLAIYDAGVRMVDDTWARLERALDEGGVWDNTLVIVLSDHGEDFLTDETRYDYKAPNHGFTPWGVDQSRVVMAVREPGGQPATRGELVGLIDVAPTVAGWTGVDFEAQGEDLRGPLPEDRWLYGETGVSEPHYWPDDHATYPFKRISHRYTVDPETTLPYQKPSYEVYTVLTKDRWLTGPELWLVEENLLPQPRYSLYRWREDRHFNHDVSEEEPDSFEAMKAALAAIPRLEPEDPAWQAYDPEIGLLPQELMECSPEEALGQCSGPLEFCVE